ncbi:hypothetical protein D9M69_237390 [compost metagenome]
MVTSWPHISSSIARLSAASRLSSTSRMRCACSTTLARPPAAARPGGCIVAAACATGSGSRNVKVLPMPGPALAAAIVPPCSSTSARHSDRPMPSPPCASVPGRLSCTNMLKMCSSDCGAMPRPWSITCTRRVRFWTVVTMLMAVCAGENFDAFRIRFCITCTSRILSACIGIDAAWVCTATCCDLASSDGRAASVASAITSLNSSGPVRSSMRPELMRPMSSRSSTSRLRCVTWRSIRLRLLLASAGSPGASRIAASALCTGASGLRSSCDSVARNSLMRWLERSSSSWRRRSLMSRVTLAKPRSARDSS